MIGTLLFPFLFTYAQVCPDKTTKVIFPAEGLVQITACVQQQVNLGKQSVFWGAKNLSNDKLHIKFTKVVTTTCGTIMRSNADTYLDPGKFVGGTTFFGEMTFETQVWAEDCKASKKRISSVRYENLIVRNLSQEERDRIEKEKKQQEERELRRRMREEQEKIEKEKKDQEEKKSIEKSKLETNKREPGSDKTIANSKESNLSQKSFDEAENKRIQDSIKQVLSNQRIESVKNLDKAEDNAMATAALAAISIGAFMKDQYSNEPFVARYMLGLGWYNIPIIANTKFSGANNETTIDASSHPILFLGFQTGLFNNKGISLYTTPKLIFGMNAISPGETGSHLIYGGDAEVRLGVKRNSKLKLYASAGWESRSGTREYDLDAASSSLNLGFGTTDLVKESKYNYSLFKYGGGIMADFSNGSEETTIRAGLNLERVSYLRDLKKPLLSFSLQANINSFITIDAQFSQNYTAAGTIKYSTNLEQSNKHFWSLTIIKTGLIDF